MYFYRLHPRLIGQAVTMNPSLMADMDKTTWNVNKLFHTLGSSPSVTCHYAYQHPVTIHHA